MPDPTPDLPWNQPGGFASSESPGAPPGGTPAAATCKMCGGIIEGWPEACPHCGEEFIRQAVRPHYRLFSVAGIVIAAFLGSLFAASVVLALNARRLGQESLVWAAPLAGFFLTFGLMVLIAFVLPDVPSLAITIPQVALAFFIAQRLQGVRIIEHRKARGELSSNWAAAGIAILCFIPLFILFVAFVFTMSLVFPDLVD